MAECPITSSSTTLTPTISSNMATTARTSTDLLGGNFVDETGQDTSTRVGDAATKLPAKPTLTPKQVSLKRNMEMESLSDSNTSDSSTSSKCAKKKSKRGKKEKVPTEGHLKIRAAVDACDRWEWDLKEVHGLSEEEACVVVSIMSKHFSRDAFPVAKGNRYVEHAREGWKLMKEIDRVRALFPEARGQTKTGKVWKML